MLDPTLEKLINEQVEKRLAELTQKNHRPKRFAAIATKGTLDMAYPPFILASSAVALGWEATVFCTFYGLDIVNKRKLPHLKVAPVGNPAMPEPIKGIPVQVPNIVGVLPGSTALGTALMKSWFHRANIPPLKTLIDVTLEGGGKVYACTTTMGVMGIGPENIIEGVECRGAAMFLDYASQADVVVSF